MSITTEFLEIPVKARLRQTIEAPYWEGLVLPGVERGDPRFEIYSAEPVKELSEVVQSIWFMNWDIEAGVELTSVVVPTPCVHLIGFYLPVVSIELQWHSFFAVKEKGQVLKLKGRGQTFGVEFKPGGLYPFLSQAVSGWENGMLALRSVFPDAPRPPEYPLDAARTGGWLERFEAYLVSRLPGIRANRLSDIGAVVDLMMKEDIRDLEDLLSQIAISKRTLQRIFQTEVGLSPREVLRIARFHRTIKSLNRQNPECLATFALDSGFFDQPHMIHEFRKLVDVSPTKFRTYW